MELFLRNGLECATVGAEFVMKTQIQVAAESNIPTSTLVVEALCTQIIQIR